MLNQGGNCSTTYFSEYIRPLRSMWLQFSFSFINKPSSNYTTLSVPWDLSGGGESMIEDWSESIISLICLKEDLSWKCVFLKSRKSRVPCHSLSIALRSQNCGLLLLKQEYWCWKSWSKVFPLTVFEKNGKWIERAMIFNFQVYCLRMGFLLAYQKNNVSYSLQHGEAPLRPAYLLQ